MVNNNYTLIKQIKEYAIENKIPIMQNEGIDFLTTFIIKHQIKNVLEIGSAIGYSAIMMSLCSPNLKITTIERDEERYLEAIKNIKKLNLEDRITLIFNDALKVKIEDKFDLIFIDAAKAQNIKFFELFEKNLNDNGYIITDSNKKTNVSGVYAAGDICEKNLRQVVTATGDGAIAATELERYAKMMQEETGIHPKPLVSKAPSKEEVPSTSTLFTSDMISQLNTVFERMENKLCLKIHINDSKTSLELKSYMEELIKLTDKLSLEVINEDGDDIPYVSVFRNDKECGMRFHGVPGGHEFTSFVLGLYNMAGSGQKISESDAMRIRQINKKTHLLIMVSLSCTMCPELVTSALKIASMNDNVDVDIYELSKFDELKNKYNVMSVPCMVINDGKPLFGKKNISELLDIIDNL